MFTEKKKVTGVWDIKKPLITHSHELGFLVYIHIFAACWESGAVAFANVHLCAICFYCIMWNIKVRGQYMSKHESILIQEIDKEQFKV